MRWTIWASFNEIICWKRDYHLSFIVTVNCKYYYISIITNHGLQKKFKQIIMIYLLFRIVIDIFTFIMCISHVVCTVVYKYGYMILSIIYWFDTHTVSQETSVLIFLNGPQQVIGEWKDFLVEQSGVWVLGLAWKSCVVPCWENCCMLLK
jgi:hypothetical protein